MSRFVKLASGVDTLPVMLELCRTDHLWDANPARRLYEGTPHAAMRDIWVRFRPEAEIAGPKSYKEEYRCTNWPAWQALPSLRPLVRALKNQVDAVELGSILITRLPAGAAILPHSDKGSWAAEWFNCKGHVTLAGAADVRCGEDTVTMERGDVFTFDNLIEHDVRTVGDAARVVLIVSMRCEP